MPKRYRATVSEGLAQGPYVAARAGFEPTTLWSKGIDSTNAPLCPTCIICIAWPAVGKIFSTGANINYVHSLS